MHTQKQTLSKCSEKKNLEGRERKEHRGKKQSCFFSETHPGFRDRALIYYKAFSETRIFPGPLHVFLQLLVLYGSVVRVIVGHLLLICQMGD